MKQEDLSEYFDRVVADTFCCPPELADELLSDGNRSPRQLRRRADPAF